MMCAVCCVLCAVCCVMCTGLIAVGRSSFELKPGIVPREPCDYCQTVFGAPGRASGDGAPELPRLRCKGCFKNLHACCAAEAEDIDADWTADAAAVAAFRCSSCVDMTARVEVQEAAVAVSKAQRAAVEAGATLRMAALNASLETNGFPLEVRDTGSLIGRGRVRQRRHDLFLEHFWRTFVAPCHPVHAVGLCATGCPCPIGCSACCDCVL